MSDALRINSTRIVTMELTSEMLAALLLCSLLTLVTSQATAGNSCTTPKNEKGACINIFSCKPMLAVLNDASVSYELKLKLGEYSCGFIDQKTPKVCCPGKPIYLTDRVENDPQDHPNAHLIPKDCGEGSALDRITNGERASLFEFPWQVALEYSSGKPVPFHCGASLINKRYVLTAAHCIAPSKFNLVGVRVGEYDFKTEEDCIQLLTNKICAPPVQNFKVSAKDATVHQDYKTSALLHDIALIRLPRDVEYNDAVGPVCLPVTKRLTPTNLRNLTVVGWGITEQRVPSTVLLRVSVPQQENTICNEKFKKHNLQIHDSQLCAGGRDGKDSCGGDSGGPIMISLNDEGTIRTVQVGLVSFGHQRCGTEGLPGVYTRITSYVDWILDNIKP